MGEGRHDFVNSTPFKGKACCSAILTLFITWGQATILVALPPTCTFQVAAVQAEVVMLQQRVNHAESVRAGKTQQVQELYGKYLAFRFGLTMLSLPPRR